MLTSPTLRHQLGENGKRLASSRYSWSAIAQDLISAYSIILEKESTSLVPNISAVA
jgi:glycosyltransferase involved in cell wall biosynthesis